MINNTSKEFFWEMTWDLKEFWKNFISKINGKEKREREEFRQKFYEDLKSLSTQQKEFFRDVIKYAEEDWRDFTIHQAVTKNRPEDYDKIMKIFSWLANFNAVNMKEVDKILNWITDMLEIEIAKEKNKDEQKGKAESLKKTL
jgi:DNA-binding ferritin-like protein (Dps family)